MMKGILIKALLICSPYLLFSNLMADLPNEPAVNGDEEANSEIYQPITRNNDYINEIETNVVNNLGVPDIQITVDEFHVPSDEEEDPGDHEEDRAENQENIGENRRNRDEFHAEEEEEEVSEAAHENQEEEEEDPEESEHRQLPHIVEASLDDLYAHLPDSFERPADEWKRCIGDLIKYQLEVEHISINNEENIKQTIEVYGMGLVRSKLVFSNLATYANHHQIGDHKLTDLEKYNLDSMETILKSSQVTKDVKMRILDSFATFYLNCFLNSNDNIIEHEEEEDYMEDEVDRDLQEALEKLESVGRTEFDAQNPYGYVEYRVNNMIDSILSSLDGFTLPAGSDPMAISTLINSRLRERAASKHRNIKNQIKNEVQIFGASLVRHILNPNIDNYIRIENGNTIIGRHMLTDSESITFNGLRDAWFSDNEVVQNALSLCYLNCLLNPNLPHEEEEEI